MPDVNSIRVPSYRKHKPTGQAVVTPGGKDHYLGRYGTPASKEAYGRPINEWLANGRQLSAVADTTIAELIARYRPVVQQHYRRPDGTPTTEVGEYRHSLRPVAHLYGNTKAKQFGPLALKAVRQPMIDGYEHRKYGSQPALARNVINKANGRT